MSEKEIFGYLFDLVRNSKDKEGSVAACLTRKGEILLSFASSDDSMFHAEELLVQEAIEEGVEIKSSDVLYTTVEPCSKRKSGKTDCCSLIIKSGIKKVVFAIPDPPFTKETQGIMKDGGVKLRQTKYQDIIEKARSLF